MKEETTPKLSLNNDLSFDNPISEFENLKGSINGVLWQPQNRVFRINATAECYLVEKQEYVKKLNPVDITLDNDSYQLLLPELMKIIEENPIVSGIVMKALTIQINK